MFSKVIVLLASVTAVLSAPQHLEAARFPAGVNPQACPNFPICDNAALHGQAPAPAPYSAPQYYNPPAPQYQPQPAYYQPQPSYYNAPALTGPVNNHLPGAGGDKYPAGVDPSSCPNYPFCDNAGVAGAPKAAPLPGFTERLYPAGVSAHECPNFPYCN